MSSTLQDKVTNMERATRGRHYEQTDSETAELLVVEKRGDYSLGAKHPRRSAS